MTRNAGSRVINSLSWSTSKNQRFLWMRLFHIYQLDDRIAHHFWGHGGYLIYVWQTKRVGPEFQRHRLVVVHEIKLRSESRASPWWRDQHADTTGSDGQESAHTHASHNYLVEIDVHSRPAFMSFRHSSLLRILVSCTIQLAMCQCKYCPTSKWTHMTLPDVIMTDQDKHTHREKFPF